MAGHKKRAFDAKQNRPSKKQKRQQQYHSDSGSDDDQEQSFDAVNLLDSDDDVHNATVDDAPDLDDHDNDSSSLESERPALMKKNKQTKSKPVKATSKPSAALDEEEGEEYRNADEESGEGEEEEEEESDVDEYDLDSDNGGRKAKSKRNDPSAFATSISKILSTKLSTSKRSDPVLSRSAAAHEASKAAVDNALEAKAKRHMKEQKKKALEKGRIREVLVASRDDFTGEPQESTTQILETERRLRKVAQRGVVKLFNAVRAAQVKAIEAEKDARRDGVIGMNNREAKVNELSKKGFLDLIASGGGGLKKGGLEEA